jgi:hypothetical protein
MTIRRFGAVILVLAAALLTDIHSLKASDRLMYYEMGIGLAQIMQSAALYDNTAPDTLGYGAAINATVAADFSSYNQPIQFHFGLQYRLGTGSKGTTQRAVQALYPIIRLEGPVGAFFTFGATPFVWRRDRQEPGINYFSRASATLGFLGEIGMAIPITPQIGWLVSLGGQFIRKDGLVGPKPSAELVIGLRINLGAPKTFGQARKNYGDGNNPGDYPGYRYPYGRELKH